jgi:catecholate siderophore receptor
VKFRLSSTVAVQLNGYNLLDKYYFDEIHPDHVVPGAGRSVALNFTVKTTR